MTRRYKKTSKKKGKFRSGFEADFAKELDRLKIHWEYETQAFAYTTKHTYTPDFYIGLVHFECKGRFTASDRSKMLAVKQDHPSADIRIVFMKDNYLYKGSKTKYSQWCDKHGFKYHVCRNGYKFPKEWLKDVK